MLNLISDKAYEIAARVWCDKEMSNITMDSDAVDSIAKIIDSVLKKNSIPNPSNESVYVLKLELVDLSSQPPWQPGEDAVEWSKKLTRACTTLTYKLPKGDVHDMLNKIVKEDLKCDL